MTDLDDLPRRIFLDTNVLSALWDHGGAIWENEPLVHSGRSGATALDVRALRDIFFINQRAMFEWVVSVGSLDEAAAHAGDPRFLGWALDVLGQWEGHQDGYIDGHGLSGEGARTAALVSRCEYLSRADARLVREAVEFECQAFLTLEGPRSCLGAHRNRQHMRRVLRLEVLGPQELWAQLRPWSGLFM